MCNQHVEVSFQGLKITEFGASATDKLSHDYFATYRRIPLLPKKDQGAPGSPWASAL